jgi:hypothetical protein
VPTKKEFDKNGKPRFMKLIFKSLNSTKLLSLSKINDNATFNPYPKVVFWPFLLVG